MVSAHSHTALIEGCYRCDLGREEAQRSEDLDVLQKVIELAHEKCRFPDEDLAIDAADAVASWACTKEGRAVMSRLSR
jgi:hypothetical protein